MNTPMLRFPEFILDWEKMKLGDVAEIGRGKSKHRPRDAEFLYGGKYPFIQTGDIRNAGLFLNSYTQTYSEAGLKQSKLWNENTLCVTIAANIAETTILKLKACFPDSVIGLIPKENKSIVLFLKFQFDKFKIEVQKFSQGLAQANLNQESLSNIQFSFPTLPEQTKIANFLSAVDTKLQALKKKKSLLEQYKKGVMQQLFSQELRFKDENGRDFPDWEVKKLGEIGTFQTSSIDKLTKENETEVYLVNYMNVYRHENINNETIKSFQIVTAKNNQIESCNLKKGDILFTPSSETPDDIGHSVVIFEGLEKAVFSYHLMRFRPNIVIDILYSHYFCNISSVLSQLTKLATGSTRFTISVKSFSSIDIHLPCLEEQASIANFLSAIDDKINNTNSQINQTELWKKGLLQGMFV